MYVHTPTLLRLLRELAAPSRFSFRRAGFVAAFGSAYAGVLGTVGAGRLLDERLFPDYREQEVNGPLFIVATPRSGTTYFHRLLGLDEQRFVDLKLYETVFPSISLQRGIEAFKVFDEMAGGHLSHLFSSLGPKLASNWEDMHRLRVDQPEEDETFFLLALLTPALYLLFPHIDLIPELGKVDDIGATVRSRLAKHYRELVQSHLFLRGKGRTALLKNVLLSGRLGVVQEAFPDARFIHLVRHPCESIPSAVSLIHAAWVGHSPDMKKDGPQARALADLFMDDYLELHRFSERSDDDRAMTVRYEDFVEDPFSTVEKVYDRFGYEFSDEYAERLRKAARRETSFQSRHRYDLREFGLDEQQIYRKLRPCFDAYGYELRKHS